ncbi:PAS domain S-box protein [Halosegnis marinus]|uniref:PAS domain S-box protein n=1 Tax=Halosegnis marinus TaxID=3034023 RepID=UPI00361CEB7C
MSRPARRGPRGAPPRTLEPAHRVRAVRGGRIEQYTDVTSIKRRERELKLRERSLRQLYDTISDTSSTFDDRLDALLETGSDMLGADAAAFLRLRADGDALDVRAAHGEADGLAVGDTVDADSSPYAAVLDTGDPVRLSLDTDGFDAPDGFSRYVGVPVAVGDSTGGVLCFLSRPGDGFDEWQTTMVELMGNWVGYELDRKRLRETQRRRLREQEDKFEQFVEAVDNYAIFTLDIDGRVTSWNPGAELIKGYRAEEILDEHFRVFYTEEDTEDGLPGRLLAEAADEGVVRHEGERVREDGSTFVADVTIAARYDTDGNHIGYTKIVRDLTDQREYEEAIERERERLEFMNRILRHNILNGLNVINMRTDFLGRTSDDEEVLDHVETIGDRVDDLSELIETMRSFMDAIVSDGSYRAEPTPLRPELDTKVSLAAESYPAAEFVTHDLPDEDTAVLADDLVGEVFENVLSNAVVHNDADEPTVEVWVSETTLPVTVDSATGEPRVAQPGEPAGEVTDTERPALAVHIADNGPGVPDEQKDAVLRKGISELSEPGNGFGLYLVKEMMAAYDGEISVRDYGEETGVGHRPGGRRGRVRPRLPPRSGRRVAAAGDAAVSPHTGNGSFY